MFIDINNIVCCGKSGIIGKVINIMYYENTLLYIVKKECGNNIYFLYEDDFFKV